MVLVSPIVPSLIHLQKDVRMDTQNSVHHVHDVFRKMSKSTSHEYHRRALFGNHEINKQLLLSLEIKGVSKRDRKCIKIIT
jgi:hypothetical protein